jgi:hypothetical protein
MIAGLFSHLVRQGTYGSEDIAVITLYLRQLQKIKKRLADSFEIVVRDRDQEELEAQRLQDDPETSTRRGQWKPRASHLRDDDNGNRAGRQRSSLSHADGYRGHLTSAKTTMEGRAGRQRSSLSLTDGCRGHLTSTTRTMENRAGRERSSLSLADSCGGYHLSIHDDDEDNGRPSKKGMLLSLTGGQLQRASYL